LSLEQEIQSQINSEEENGEEGEQPQEEKKEMVLPISGVVNSIFLFLSKDWDEEDRQKLILDDMESENLNEMLTPMILKIAEKLGLAIDEISALIGLSGLLLPRIFLYMNLKKKYEKKKKEVEKKNESQGKEENSSG